jgi:Super-infection exclusion protein B
VDKFLGSLTDWSKFPPRVLLALTVICGVFVFGGSDFLKTLGLDLIQTQYRPLFGLGFLVFGALLLSFPIAEGGKWIYQKLYYVYDQGEKKKFYLEWFKVLTPPQKEILRGYIDSDTRSRSLDFNDGVVKELVNTGIIYLPGRYSRLSIGWRTDYLIMPWVFTYLKEHPEILV